LATGWGLHGQLNEGFQGYLSYSTNTTKCYGTGGGFTWTPVNSHYVYHDAFGVSHPFAYVANYCTETFTGGGPASDGSGYSYSGGYVTSADGKLINAPVNNQSSSGTLTDTNGNVINNNGNGTFTDTLGKTAMTISGSGTASSPKVFTYSALTDNATVTITYVTYTVRTNFGCAATGYNLSQDLPDRITLGDGSFYKFTYEATPGFSGDVTGRLASLTLPQGGVISYAYTGANNGIVCADGTPTGLTRTGGVNRTYVRSAITATSSHTDIVDGLSNDSGFDFVMAGSPESFYETNRSVHQGSSSGPVLLARQTCYGGAAHPCTTTAIGLPVSQIDTYETFNSAQQHGSTITFNAYGLQTGETDFDFGGPSSRGAPLRSEGWAYPTSGIVSLVSFDTVVDGSNNQIGLTNYHYDETTGAGHAALVTTTGLPNHVAAGAQRGNLTTVSQSFSAAGSLTNAGAYEDTGDLLSSLAPSGASTYAYDTATHAFTTTATPPLPSSGVSLPSSATNDVNTSLPLTTTDPNNQAVTYKSYDQLLRPTEIDYPDGGKMIAGYTATQTGVYHYMTGSTHTNTQTNYDGYGRYDWVAVQNASGGYYWNNSCYDNNGNVQFAAYRFTSGTLVCSGAGDTYTYDALGRVLKITHGDSSTVNYSYNGRATQVTDENGVSRITQADGLGRPTAVCGVSNSTLQGVAPAACGLDIAATGFLTTYAYSTDTSAGNARKTVVTQGAQTRTFETDWLGRTTLVTQPESGTATYSYAYSATSGLGLTVTRKRPTANQSNPSVYTTTTTQYDSLGRVVSVTYTDGTPTKVFSYDAASTWTEAAQQTNLKGRLSAHYRTTAAGGAGSIYGYDAMGRATLQYSCLPSGCGNSTYDRGIAYTYNQANMLTSEGDGAGDTYTYSRSIAGEITGLTDSFSDATDPANIIVPGSVQNGPFGPTTYNLGNGLTAVNTYDSLGRSSGGYVCAGSSQPGCTGGTQQVYGYTAGWVGAHVTGTCDTVLTVCNSFGYDEFSRLTARTVTQGTVQNFTYTYDRYGNRWAQNAPQGGPALSISFNQGNNIINTSGFTNDVLGNVSDDTFHTYSYDADGNLISVDGGATATYYYDSLNQRVRIAPTRGTYEFVWDTMGRRVSTWYASTRAFDESNAYTDWGPISTRLGGQTQFEHQNWLGTERVRTTYNGAVAISISSLPWADDHTPSGDNGDQHDFAGMERDLEDNSEHAQYRQFSTNLGRWQSPDPYLGSYDLNNPQSMNRYSYALNNPASLVDPSGLDTTQLGACGVAGVVGDDEQPLPLFCVAAIYAPLGGGCSNQPWLCWSYPGAGYGGSQGYVGGGGGGGSSTSSAPSKTLGTCRVGSSPSHTQYAQAFGAVADLSAQFFSGLGPSDNTFGLDSAVSQVMAQSPGVQDALNGYNINGTTSGTYNFGPSGAIAAGNNIVAQFVGGYSYSISPASGGINLSLSNYTSFRSLSYDSGPSWPRGPFYPMGTTHQTYNIFVPCS
jgi:RHS repeat-associated protein